MSKRYYTTQKEVLGAIIRGENLFCTGAAGSGKSYLINQVRTSLKGVVVTASTGIAAKNINGQTIHSWIGVGFADDLENVNIPIGDAIAKVVGKALKRHTDSHEKAILDARVLIIDEVSMLNGAFIDVVDIVCRRVRGDNRPFGGIQVVAVGDLFQLPPVWKRKDRDGNETRKPLPCFESNIFQDPEFKKANLKEIFRQKDPVFVSALNNIRLGRVTETINALFVDREKRSTMIPKQKHPVVLMPHNSDVEKANNFHLDQVPGDLRISEMKGQGNEIDQKKLAAQILPPQSLRLKLGARVMSTRNSAESGYYNGSLGVVKTITGDAIGVEFDGSPEVVEIRKHKWTTLTEEEKEAIERAERKGEPPPYPDNYAEISQFPLVLGYAMSIHKSQGLTFDTAMMDLGKIFEDGQAYVALSRVKSLDGLYLKGWNPRRIKAPPDAMEYMMEHFAAARGALPYSSVPATVPHIPVTAAVTSPETGVAPVIPTR